MTSSKAGALIRHSSDWRRGLLANWSAVQNFARIPPHALPPHYPAKHLSISYFLSSRLTFAGRNLLVTRCAGLCDSANSVNPQGIRARLWPDDMLD
jgi:hypothetical protein